MMRAIPAVIAIALLAAFAPAASAQRGDARLGQARELVDQAWVDIRAGRPVEAAVKARQALELRERALGPSHPAVAGALHALARALQEGGDWAAARPLVERALRIREQSLRPDDPQIADSLYHLGIVTANLADYPAALAAHERALAIRERALGPDHPDVAASLQWLSWVHRQRGDYGRARPLVERALRIREARLGPDHLDVAATLDELGALLRMTDDLDGSRAALARSLAIREGALGPTHPLVAQSVHDLGWTLYSKGDYGAARAAFERALAIRQSALGAASRAVAATLAGLGTVAWIQGDFAVSRASFERSLAIWEQARGAEHPDVAVVLNDYALLLRSLGDYAGARARLERALAINERALGPDSRRVGQTLYNLAFVHQTSGDPAGARALNDRSLAIRERALGPDHFDVALSLGLAGNLRAGAGDYAGARPLYERALRIYEKTRGPEHRNVANTLVGLARVQGQTGDRDGARQTLERALLIQERALGPGHPEVAWTLTSLGYLALDAGAPAAARPRFERALAITDKAPAPDVAWRAASGLGRVEEAGQRWVEAVALHRRAVAALEALGGQFGGDEERLRFLQTGNRLSAYDALARSLMRLHEREPGQGHEREAWAVLDARRRRVAAETLTAARPAPRDPRARAEMATALSTHEQALALERDLQEEQARGGPERQPERIRALTTLLARTKSEYLAQVTALLERYPQYKSQFVDQQTVDPKALAKFADRLPAGTLAVQYFAAVDRLYVFAVARGGSFLVKSEAVSQEELFRLVRRYRALVERGTARRLPWRDDGSDAYRDDVAPLKAVTRELSQHLLGPIEAELRTSQGLVLIPNDLLLYLPFHALTREGPDGTARFLAETHAVSYVTQLELADLLGASAPAADAPLLAVSNPDGTLPAASREVRALARIRRAITALDGPQATKATFLSQAGAFSNLHLATHGVLDPRHPERSYLLLAGGEESEQRLGIDEIAGLSLHSGLTVLSACETALGEQVPGAALITLAAAFSQAGSQSIVASLWRVNDTATRDFMVAFYEGLGAGRAAALDRAQIALLSAPATQHPYYWAPFILIGAR